MTKTKMTYENGKIYKIIGTDPNDKCYIGSTTKQYLSQRMTKHVCEYKRWKNGNTNHKVMSFEIFDKYGVGNCSIILLETCNVNSKDELRSREQHYIDTLNCVNKQKAILTPDQNRLYKKQHRIDNIDAYKASVATYRSTHKNEIAVASRNYYQLNKETLLENKKVKIFCDLCNCSTAKRNIARHNMSPKHFQNMKELVKRYQQEKPIEVFIYKLQ